MDTDDELIEGLVSYRKKEDISQKEMVRRLNAVEGAKPISKAGYTAIEQQRKGRKASRASIALLMRYFQSIKHAKMVLILLRCIDTDPEALHRQLESAAWRRFPEAELPRVNDIVLVSYTRKGKPEVEKGHYCQFRKEWFIDIFGSITETICTYHKIKITAWQPLPKPAPMLEAEEGGGDDE